jgi:acetyl-CoA C-acetyltransferase
MSEGLFYVWDRAFLIDGVRTPFVDYCGALSQASPTDLGIKVARAIYARTEIAPNDTQAVIAGSVAQASYDAYMLPRHIGLYAGLPEAVPAVLVQRVCGTGIEILAQAADQVQLGRADLVLCAGAESMSRNPVTAYTHRTGFRIGQVEFKDFLWESLLDTGCNTSMGGTAENLARRYEITRSEVDAFAARSFARAVAAQESGLLQEEIVEIRDERFEQAGLQPRGITLRGKVSEVGTDTHVQPSSLEVLSRIRPAFGGVQTGGNSSAVVDGAAAALVASSAYVERKRIEPIARIRACAVVGVQPELMGIGPVPAIELVLRRSRLTLDQVDRFEINEAFGAQVLACARQLALPEERLNVNGGAIALGHPLAATGLRIALTAALELRRRKLALAVAAACIGGGQGIALLIENPSARARR